MSTQWANSEMGYSRSDVWLSIWGEDQTGGRMFKVQQVTYDWDMRQTAKTTKLRHKPLQGTDTQVTFPESFPKRPGILFSRAEQGLPRLLDSQSPLLSFPLSSHPFLSPSSSFFSFLPPLLAVLQPQYWTWSLLHGRQEVYKWATTPAFLIPLETGAFRSSG